jgi:signal transduction histidine kinase
MKFEIGKEAKGVFWAISSILLAKERPGYCSGIWAGFLLSFRRILKNPLAWGQRKKIRLLDAQALVANDRRRFARRLHDAVGAAFDAA